jgi:hypothetical protein
MSLEELLHDYYANLLYLKCSTQNTFPHFSTENEASRQLSQTPRQGSMSYDKCVVLIQTIPACKNLARKKRAIAVVKPSGAFSVRSLRHGSNFLHLL